jgi:hypothetical protein
MVVPKQSARESANWFGDRGTVWLDHVTLAESDREWLADVTSATFWNVKFPEGFLSRLSRLEYLDIRGGSGGNAEFVSGCRALKCLTINQVRGMTDLSAIENLTSLRYLSLFGLPKVARIPSLRALVSLDRVEIGSMKGLTDLAGLFAAPSLTELVFIKSVGATMADAATIASHPTIEKFRWEGEDVPVRVWVPFVELVGKPQPRFDWLDRHSHEFARPHPTS